MLSVISGLLRATVVSPAQSDMDAKDSFAFLVLLLFSLGLFGSLSLTYCVWSKQTEVASELQNELHTQSEVKNEVKNELVAVRNELHELQKKSELAAIQGQLHSKLQSELAEV